MGMYTGLRAKVIIKKEYRDIINQLMNEGKRWENLRNAPEFVETYSRYSRANFVPFGALCYMPDSWEKAPYNQWNEGVATQGFEASFNNETGYWSFQCSLKNYDKTIEYFFENVLSEIIENVIHLEYFYEEWENSAFYELIDGAIIKRKKQGNDYSLKYI